jgi:hypothetical protein
MSVWPKFSECIVPYFYLASLCVIQFALGCNFDFFLWRERKQNQDLSFFAIPATAIGK